MALGGSIADLIYCANYYIEVVLVIECALPSVIPSVGVSVSRSAALSIWNHSLSSIQYLSGQVDIPLGNDDAYIGLV